MLEMPHAYPKKELAVDDNARKFIVRPIDESFLKEREASATRLIVHWLEIDKDGRTETKLAYKKDLSNDTIKILLITKTTDKDGARKTTRKNISEAEYEQYKKSLNSEDLCLEKTRWEFTYIHDNIRFPMKYDVFADSELRMLEVEDSSGEDRFNSDNFPIELREVSNDPRYSGYRVAEVIDQPLL